MDVAAAPRPTILQRFFASPWPAGLWFAAFSLAGAALAFDTSARRSLLTWPDGPLTIVIALVGAIAGFFIAVALAGPILSGLFDHRARLNGGPFKPGDRVYIIHGPHAGTITTVTGPGQFDSVSVDLGEKARRDYNDYFSGTELLRVQTPEAPITPQQG